MLCLEFFRCVRTAAMKKMNKSSELDALFKLLDDSEPTLVRPVMSKLLQYDPSVLESYLAKLQESSDPLVRKRCHQLQAILLLRERRIFFSEMLNRSDMNLIDGLIEIHLQWYDNDSEPDLEELWGEFSEAAEGLELNSLEKVAYFMRRCSFALPQDNDFCAPELYCIGSVLEDRIGADILLCSIALVLAAENHLELRLIRLFGNFMLMDNNGRLLSPQNGWQLLSYPQHNHDKECEFWDDSRMILKYVAGMVFLYAVGTDSFRYVHTIGHALSGLADGETLDFLPYPYGKNIVGRNDKNESKKEL